MSLCVFAAARDAPTQAALALGPRTWTWAELAAETASALVWLEAHHIRPGMPAPPVGALDARPTLSNLVMLYALISAGIPVLPLHPRLNPGERQAQLDLAGAALHVDEHWDEQVSSVAGATVPVALPSDERWLAAVFTSGTTGFAKGVVLSRRAAVASAVASARNLEWQTGDRWMLSLPFAHVGGLSIITRCLLARRCVAVAPETREPGALHRWLAQERVTLLSLVPTQLVQWLAEQPEWQPHQRLRAVLLGGAPAGAGLVQQAADRGVPVLLTYGLTETFSQIATQRYGGITNARDCLPPLFGSEIACPRGVIHVRGPMLFSGYLGGERGWRPDEWFCTDDYGELDEQGHLHVHGRREELLNTGGENVSALEVESVLVSCPAIAEACVVGIPDETWGQSVAAVVVPEDPASDVVPALVELAGARLASFKRPRCWAILSELPRTPSGKVDRAAVRRLADGRWRRSEK